MKSILFFMVVGFLGTPLGAMESQSELPFIVRAADQSLRSMKLGIDFDEDSSLQISGLSRLCPEGSELECTSILSDAPSDGAIFSPRTPNAAEQALDMGVISLTGGLVLMVSKTYDLSSHLRFATHRGVMFFILPFEEHFLYYRCQTESSTPGREFLIATTVPPRSSRPDRLVSIEDALEACETPGVAQPA